MNQKKAGKGMYKTVPFTEFSETKTYLMSLITKVNGFKTLFKNFLNGQNLCQSCTRIIILCLNLIYKYNESNISFVIMLKLEGSSRDQT